MSSAPYMQFYVGDYIKKTLHLSTEENGAYLLLLFAMWQGDASLPNDATKLARIARVSPKRWAKVWPEIAGFFTVDGDVIYQDRLTKELQKVLSISRERKTAGSLGGKAKALKDNVVRLAIATDLPWHSQISEPEPDKKEEKEEAIASSKKPAKRRPEIELPPDWVPSERNIQDAQARNFTASEIDHEADKFRNHHLARGNRYRDWDRAWLTWLGNTSEFRARGGMAGQAKAPGYGQRSSLASIVARRRAQGEV